MSNYLKYLTGIYILLTLLLLTPRIHGNDGIGYFVYLRSMVFDGDLDFTDEFAHYGEQYKVVGFSPVTGRPVNGVPIGSAILWLPCYLLAHLLVIVLKQFNISWVADGYSLPYVIATTLGSSLYGFLGLSLIYRIARRFFSENRVFSSLLIFWLSSPLVFYMFLHPSMAHANSVFTVSLFIYLWLRIYMDNQQRVYDWIFLGISAGLMVIVRLQDGLFLLLLIFLFIPQPNPGFIRKNLLYFVCFLMAFLITFCPQLIAWKVIFGSYFSGPESHTIGQNLNLMNPKILSVLFSGRHGLIIWNPVILLALMGIPLVYPKNKNLVIGLVIVFLMQLWMISSWREWWGAHSFGHRMFISAVPFFILGFCGFLEFCHKHLIERTYHMALYTIGIFLVVWNFGLMVQYTTGILDRDGTTPFVRIIKNQFTLVPQKLVSGLADSYGERFNP